jgi:hypothetical protein
MYTILTIDIPYISGTVIIIEKDVLFAVAAHV